MKKRFLILTSLLIVGSVTAVFAQDQTILDLANEAQEFKSIDDTSSKPWRTGAVFNLNFGQTSLTNWAAGGDRSSISLTGLFNGYASLTKDRSQWDNFLDLGYGFTNTTSTGHRKSEDHLYFTSQYGYQIKEDSKWFYSGLIDFKSQFAKGYMYDGNNNSTLISRMLAPAYILVSAGINYKPTNYLTLFLSPITERWTIVSDDTLSAQGKYGVTPGKHVLNEVGAFFSARFKKDIATNVNLSSRLDLYSNYKHNPKNVDVNFTNLLSMKINKYLAATLSLTMIYDDDTKIPEKDDPSKESARLQVQEVLGVGFTYNF